MIQLALYGSITNPPHGANLERCIDETSAAAHSGFD